MYRYRQTPVSATRISDRDWRGDHLGTGRARVAENWSSRATLSECCWVRFGRDPPIDQRKFQGNSDQVYKRHKRVPSHSCWGGQPRLSLKTAHSLTARLPRSRFSLFFLSCMANAKVQFLPLFVGWSVGKLHTFPLYREAQMVSKTGFYPQLTRLVAIYWYSVVYVRCFQMQP
jgi:hypothetical protein